MRSRGSRCLYYDGGRRSGSPAEGDFWRRPWPQTGRSLVRGLSCWSASTPWSPRWPISSTVRTRPFDPCQGASSTRSTPLRNDARPSFRRWLTARVKHYENGVATHRVYGAICESGSSLGQTAPSGHPSPTNFLPARVAIKSSPTASQSTGDHGPVLLSCTASLPTPTATSAAVTALWDCRLATSNPMEMAASTASSMAK